MPVSDLDCINLICDAYHGTGTFDQSLMVNYVDVRIKQYPDATVIVFPGSKSFIDWMRDFEADLRLDPDLGPIEWGFQQGLAEVYRAISIGVKPIYITGHSLGAARALIFAAILKTKSYWPTAVVTFGSPRPGAQKLKDILAPLTVRSYKNGDDKVCRVPFYIPLFKPYVHPSPLIQVNVPAEPGDNWGPFRYHHSELYRQALAQLIPARAA